MKLYAKDGSLLRDVAAATCSFETNLMGSTQATVSFLDSVSTKIAAGGYVDVPEEGRFYLIDDYVPVESASGYAYDIPYKHFTELFKASEFYFEDATGTRQYIWTISANLDTVAQLVNEAIQRDFPDLGVTIGSVKGGTSNKDITFDGLNVYEAIAHIASEFETEWWAYDLELNFDFALFNEEDPYLLTHGVNINDEASISYPEDRAQYIRAFGGTTNMPLQAESLVSYMPRVAMPEGYEVIEVPGINTGITEIRTFDDIFPLMDGEVTEVKYNGSDTNPIYYIKTDLGHNIESVKAAGKVPVLRFTSGIHNGRDFEIDDTTIDGESWVEIFRTEDNGIFVPRPYLDPRVGDTFLLEGVTVAPAAITEASTRLLAEVQKEVQVLSTATPDISGMVTNGVAFGSSGGRHYFRLGESVRVTHPSILLGVAQTRVTSIAYSLDAPSIVTLGCTDEVAQGVLSSLEDEVKSVTVNLDTFMNDSTHDSRYLRKDKPDRARGVISSDRGFRLGFGEGDFAFDANGHSYVAADYIYANVKAVFNTLETSRVQANSANRVASAASITISRVERIEDHSKVWYRCFFVADDGDTQVKNDFVAGDLAYSITNSVKQTGEASFESRYYWAEVWRAGEDHVDLFWGDSDWPEYPARDTSSDDIPQVGDVLVQRGSRNDPTRANFIEENGVGANAPSYTLYTGVGLDFDTRFSLKDKEMFEIKRDPTTGRAAMNVFGDVWIGNRDRTEGVAYDSEEEKLRLLTETIARVLETQKDDPSVDKSSIRIDADGMTSTDSEGVKGFTLTGENMSSLKDVVTSAGQAWAETTAYEGEFTYDFDNAEHKQSFVIGYGVFQESTKVYFPALTFMIAVSLYRSWVYVNGVLDVYFGNRLLRSRTLDNKYLSNSTYNWGTIAASVTEYDWVETEFDLVGEGEFRIELTSQIVSSGTYSGGTFTGSTVTPSFTITGGDIRLDAEVKTLNVFNNGIAGVINQNRYFWGNLDASPDTGGIFHVQDGAFGSELVEQWISNENGYRKYANGVLEQWGLALCNRQVYFHQSFSGWLNIQLTPMVYGYYSALMASAFSERDSWEGFYLRGKLTAASGETYEPSDAFHVSWRAIGVWK